MITRNPNSRLRIINRTNTSYNNISPRQRLDRICMLEIVYVYACACMLVFHLSERSGLTSIAMGLSCRRTSHT